MSKREREDVLRQNILRMISVVFFVALMGVALSTFASASAGTGVGAGVSAVSGANVTVGHNGAVTSVSHNANSFHSEIGTKFKLNTNHVNDLGKGAIYFSGTKSAEKKSTKSILGSTAMGAGILAANFIGGPMLSKMLNGDNEAAKATSDWTSGIGSLGALVGTIWGPAGGAIGGATGGLIGGILGMLEFARWNDHLYSLKRSVTTRVISLDVNNAIIYDAKFKNLGDTTPSKKYDANMWKEKSFLKKTAGKYYYYTPIMLQHKGVSNNPIDAENLVVTDEGLEEYLHANLGKTNSAFSKYQKFGPSKEETPAYASALNLGDDAKQNIGWCQVNDESILAENDKEVSDKFIVNLAKDETKAGQESFIMLLKNISPEKENIQIPNYNCFGPNGRKGITGKQASPKVKYEWKWNVDPDWNEVCTGDLKNKGIYCDSTQMMMALLKRLESYNEKVKTNSKKIENTADLNIPGVQKILHFKSHLMFDGYTKDFLNDFRNYSKNEFMDFSSLEKKIIAGLIPEGKDSIIHFAPLSGESINPEGYKLPYAGYYNVDIVITFNKTNKVYLYDNSQEINSDVESVTVFFEPISKALNPVYYMPLDATVGVVNSEINRTGYGVDYKSKDGSAIWFKNNPSEQSMLLSPTMTSNSTPIVHLDMTSVADPDVLNGNMRGVVLDISPRSSVFGATYDVTRYLSLPSVVDLNIKRENIKNGGIYAFYTLKMGSTPVNGGRSLIYWNLFCGENKTDCKSFTGATPLTDMFLPDKIGTDAKVAPTGQLQNVTYGLEWDKDSVLASAPKEVNYRGFVYLPETTKEGTMQIVLSSDKDTQITSDLNPINGAFTDIQDIYDGVDQNMICVSKEGAGIRFWWNPGYMLNNQKK